MARYEVWIFDEESGCEQPMTVDAQNNSQAKMMGNQYIKAWNLRGASITKIKKVESI